MKQGIPSKTCPTEREIELGLRPRVFIGYSEGFSFLSKLEEVAAKIRRLCATEPGRVVGLYETFLAGRMAWFFFFKFLVKGRVRKTGLSKTAWPTCDRCGESSKEW